MKEGQLKAASESVASLCQRREAPPLRQLERELSESRAREARPRARGS